MSCSSKQSYCNGENGELHASQRRIYTDDYKGGDKKMWSGVPRHRIAGKQRMPPYIDAPVIQVPEPRPRRSTSRKRDGSRERRPKSRDRLYYNEGQSNRSGRDTSVKDRKLKDDIIEDDISRKGHRNSSAICLPICQYQEVQEPLCVKDAVVMVLNKACLSTIPGTKDDSTTHEENRKSKKPLDSALQKTGKTKVTFDTALQSSGKSKATFDSASQVSKEFQRNRDIVSQKSSKDRSEHILDKKVPPMYIPRPCHRNDQDNEEYEENDESEVSSIESEPTDRTPWGNLLPSIKVTRIKRENDDEDVEVKAPEGTLPVCARCGVAVYLAEEKGAAGRKFHSSCFKCFLCNSSLDSFSVNERNQEIYCRHCYIRQFGPKGYDFGAGEGALQTQ